ncbi:MAG: DUF499 domain-containing protein [Candidatus Schekmanbacteria bacterium]|nr:DUF499 domain-containing protein [Candidatus Schekmanbacteria bacterium]
MLGLELREEFRGKRLKGTQIELPDAVKLAAADFLRITYPTGDVLAAVESIGPEQGRPVVLIGERGQGKSHLMAALVHALNDAVATRTWLMSWADRLAMPKVADMPLRSGVHVISENLHRQNYKFLWDLLFERHPKGEFIKGKWEAQGDKKTNVPSDKLLLEMFESQPTALVLDEYQTWFDGLTDSRVQKSRVWAFNFIQLLSEIAKDRPDLLVLVVSLRNGHSDAYQQVLRVNPVLVDWKGQNAKKDRQRLLLHRLFENRLHVAPADITSLIGAHVEEHIRLLDVTPAERDRTRREFMDAWPFAPHLMQLLEDQVLIATSAQETRDLIKILADLFKRHSDGDPILTAADFRLDDDKSGIASLLDSVANQAHQNLREKALRNLEAVRDAVKDAEHVVPHLAEIVAALWVRSLAVGNMAGATAPTLHVDVTRAKVIDDNAFQDELNLIVENSFNIHLRGDRLLFKDEENPRARLMASARNDKLFAAGQPMAGQDRDQLAKEVRYVIGDATSKQYRVVVLGPSWLTNPWDDLDESERAERWTDNRIPLVVLPECPDKLDQRLGKWLKDHLQKRRNTVRFLLPFDGAPSAYHDRDLLVLSRAVCLADAWKVGSPEYRKLQSKYEGELRNVLKKRFDRFAVLETWSFADTAQCKFHVVAHQAQGAAIPEAVDKHIREQLFIPEDFEEMVLAAAENTDSVAKLLGELQEPRPNGDDCVAWVGETLAKEKIERLCAKGKIAIDLRGSQYLQAQEGEDENAAWAKVRGRLGTGKHLDETRLLLPQAVPRTGGVKKPTEGETGTGSGDGGTTATGGDSEGEGADGSDTTTGEAGGGADIGDGESTGTVGGDIFGDGPTKTYSAPATSSLNLMAKVEAWGIGQFTQVRSASLRVEGLTGAKLNELLKKLPDGVTYALDVEKEEG